MVQFNVNFLGTTVVDKRFSNPMVPWVIADIKRRRHSQKIKLTINNGEFVGELDDFLLFRHELSSSTQNLHRFCLDPKNATTFMHLVKDKFEPVLNVYLFEAAEYGDVMEIFQSVRESTREMATLTSLCPDISPTNSQYFEVLYVGKMWVSHRIVPETFIDDALEKFRLERAKKQLGQTQEINENGKFSDSSEKDKSKIPENNNGEEKKSDDLNKEGIKNVLETLKENSTRVERNGLSENSKSFDFQGKENVDGNSTIVLSAMGKSKSDAHSEETKSEMRYKMTRSGSLGVIETCKKKSDDVNQNRTMLFYVGRTDLRLISPDRKQVLLRKILKEINCCIQGIQNNQHFGIITREMDGYTGYVFKCESNSVADHIVSAITQTFQVIKEVKDRPKQPAVCDHCPMVWFHKLCAEIEDQNEKKRQLTILKKIETLPEHEQTDIHTKFLGAESSDIRDQNEFLMILLRTHCERKQSRHIHDTEENRHEFLNQVLGGNTIFMKAKRSLTSSFDHLLKRKGSQQDVLHTKESANRKSDFTVNDSSTPDEYHRSYLTVGPADGEIMKREISKQMNSRMQDKRSFQGTKGSHFEGGILRKTASLQETSDHCFKDNEEFLNRTLYRETEDEADASKTPLMNIYLKVGSGSKKSQDNMIQEEANQTPSGSWRQAIFNRVVTPGKADEAELKKLRKRNKEELRDLWKTAINQQILLIRMERENAQLRARQEEATVKRIKLEYDELGNFVKEQMGLWELITNKDNRISPKCDSQLLLQAVRQGIPRARRGDVWYYFANKFCLNQAPFDSTPFPNYDVPYEDLLKQLTSFQHTILIDIGRTFPNHPYFSSPLGPGQLALFNLLKAYSLLDPQVGYCQGLSFVAGVLLLHLSEDQAFLLLRHLMFRRNLRKQYLPDMAALQVQLYQISRLLHDSLPKLYVHFDKNEITPTLYAASWMLTLFASQFSLGFVTRVFDLIFVEQTTDIILRVIIALFEEHNATLLKLASFEEIMDYLKHDIPKMDATFVDRLMKKVLSMDISKQLHEYEVEYHVLQEEISTPKAELDRLRKVDVDNKKLLNENMALQEQLEVLTKNVSQLEKFKSAQQGTIKKLETKVKTLEMTVKFLGDFIAETREKHKNIEVPGEIRRIIANLDAATEEGTVAKPKKEAFKKSAFFRRIHSTSDCYERPDINEFCTIKDLPSGTKFGNRLMDSNESDKNSETETGTPINETIKGVPLRVIADDEKYQPPQSSNLTSKITSGVSSFFNSSGNSGNSIKNDKSQKTWTTDNFKSVENNRNESSPIKYNFSSDIGSLHLKETALRSDKKENLLKNKHPSQDVNVPFEKRESETDGHHLHPLDCSNGVSITFNGTTKLKSIKSGHQLIKNHSIDLIPINNNLLHISEDGDS